MKEPIYITISEFGDIRLIRSHIAPDVLEAADDGLYDIIDITDSDHIMMYYEKSWVDVEEMPDYSELES